MIVLFPFSISCPKQRSETSVTGFPSIVSGIATSVAVPIYLVTVTSPLLIVYFQSDSSASLAPATNGMTLNMPITIIADNNTEVILFNFVIIFPPKK